MLPRNGNKTVKLQSSESTRWIYYISVSDEVNFNQKLPKKDYKKKKLLLYVFINYIVLIYHYFLSLNC